MLETASEIVQAVLRGATDPAVIEALVAPDATYVSLAYDDPDLKRIMPWAGSHRGANAILETFVDVNRHWEILGFEVQDSVEAEGKVALFVRCTFRSRVMDAVYVSPVAVFGRVEAGKVVHMQFMEDTFGTASTFRSGGAWTFRADPDEPEVTIKAAHPTVRDRDRRGRCAS